LFLCFWQLKQGHAASNQAQDLQKVTKFYCKRFAPNGLKKCLNGEKAPNLVILLGSYLNQTE